MNIKTIVKVMNFHALLRVDSSRREAEQYKMLEKEVAAMIDIVQHNRNFILDKWILKEKEGAPRLRIYIGSDLGFCGSINGVINNELEQDTENVIVSIGKKLRNKERALLCMNREEFQDNYNELYDILTQGVKKHLYSGIDICYNHYHNTTNIEPIIKTIFPIALEKEEETNKVETYSEDFSIEGGRVDELLEDLVITYLSYEIKTAAVNAFAAENILRQNATNESLKKIDEIELEKRFEERKRMNHIGVLKVIDSYVKTKRKGGAKDNF